MSDEHYPQGATVRFMDGSATVSEAGTTVLAEGIVNGPAVTTDTGNVFVPVFSQRDNGREPTTVYVREENIMEVRGVDA